MSISLKKIIKFVNIEVFYFRWLIFIDFEFKEQMYTVIEAVAYSLYCRFAKIDK